MRAEQDIAVGLDAQLAAWCDEQGVSMRALSLEIGRGAKAVSDIVHGKSRRPDAETVRRLRERTGLDLALPTLDPRDATRAGPYMDGAIDAVLASDRPDRDAIARDVRLVCRWLGRDPAEVPADPAWLRRRFAAWTGATHGVTAKRLSNIKTCLNRALELVGTAAVRKPILTLCPAWRGLWDAIPIETRVLKGSARTVRQRPHWAAVLSPFMRWCDAEGIGPDAVDGDAFERYAQDRARLSVKGFGSRQRSELRSAWRTAMATVPGWPQHVDTTTPRRDALTLPLDAFTESFREDVEAYCRARGLRDHVEIGTLSRLERARARRASTADGKRKLREALADTTLASHVDTLRLAASRMVASGHYDLTEIESVADVAEVGALATVLDDIAERTGLDSQYAGSVAKILTSIALRWRADLSLDELDQMKTLREELVAKVDRNAMPTRDRGRLMLFRAPEAMLRLVQLPEALCQSARERDPRSACNRDPTDDWSAGTSLGGAEP